MNSKSSNWSRRLMGAGSTSLDAALELTRGTMRDYAALCEHHYKADRPATCTRVLALRHRAASAADRFAGRPPADAKGRVVGVLVESLPALNCLLRDWALGGRYASFKDARSRAKLLTAELRCISRVVVHPQWRGLGLAVRLVRAALAQPQTIYTESLAAMGHVNPFFEHAGMTAYRRPAHAFDRRLTDALGAAGFEPTDLAALEAMLRRIKALAGPRRRWLLAEVRRWYCQTHRRSAIEGVSVRQRLAAAQKRLLCEPVYYLSDNRVLFMECK